MLISGLGPSHPLDSSPDYSTENSRGRLQDYSDLLSRAEYEMGRGDLHGAAGGLARLAQMDGVPAALRDRARRHLTTLQGSGAFDGERVDFLAGQFLSQVFDPVGLSAMVGAGLTYRVARGACLAVAARWGVSGAWVRPAAVLTAFSAEATAFPLYGNGAAMLLGRQVNWQDFHRQVAGSFLFLGGLKVFHHFGAAARSLVQRGPLAPLAPWLTQGFTYAGIVSGHGAEQLLGLTPNHGMASLMGESLVTLLHFNAAGRLIPHLTGTGLQQFERDLDLDWYRHGRLRRMGPAMQRSATGPIAALRALGMGLGTLLWEGVARAQEGMPEANPIGRMDDPLDWVLTIGALALTSVIALRTYLRYRRVRQMQRAMQDPDYFHQLEENLPLSWESIQILQELGKRHPDAIRALHEAAQRAAEFASSAPQTEVLFQVLHHFDVEHLAEAALEDPGAMEALRILADRPYHNRQAFQAIQRIPIPIMEAYTPLAMNDMTVAYTFWKIAHGLHLPNGWGVVMGFDWNHLYERASGDWRAAEMILTRSMRNQDITLEDIQSFPVAEMWRQTPEVSRAHVVNHIVERLALLGNAEALELLRSLSPEALIRSLPQNKELFETLGVLGEYGTLSAVDSLAGLAERHSDAMVQLVRLANYGNVIAGNLLRSLNLRHYETQAPGNPDVLAALLVLHRNGHPAASHALRRILEGDALLEFQELEAEEESDQRDTNMPSPKHRLRQECEFCLDTFAKMPPSDQIRLVNLIWERWHALGPRERLDYYTRDKESVFNSLVPVVFMQEILEAGFPNDH